MAPFGSLGSHFFPPGEGGVLGDPKIASLLLWLMTIRKELNYQMEIFWSGVKAVQIEKY